MAIGSCGAVASTRCHELTGKAMKFSIKSVMLLTLFVAMALTIGLLARELHVRRLQYEALRQEIAEDPKRMFYAERFRAKADERVARFEKQRQQVIEINHDLTDELERLKQKVDLQEDQFAYWRRREGEYDEAQDTIRRMTDTIDIFKKHSQEATEELAQIKKSWIRAEIAVKDALLRSPHNAVRDDIRAIEQSNSEAKP
jgi:hypothetical protein